MIDVRYTYDINGILEVEVTSVDTGIKKRLVIQKNSGNITEEEIQKRFEELKDLKIHPRDQTENRLLLARDEHMYEEALGEERNYISDLLQKFESILALQDDRKARKAAEELKRAFDEIERRFEY